MTYYIIRTGRDGEREGLYELDQSMKRYVVTTQGEEIHKQTGWGGFERATRREGGRERAR